VITLSLDTDLANADWIKSVSRVAAFDPNQARDEYGRWVAGTGMTPEAVAAERAHQETLAAAQTNPLAHPAYVIGLDQGTLARPLHQEDVQRYVAAYGREFEAQPLPHGFNIDEPNQCYRNASLTIITHPELTYAEGFATKTPGGLAVLHAWGVTTDGKVVDPTLPDPSKWKYFGIQYDRKAYLSYLYKAGKYGVLGSTQANANRAIATGGKGLR
jgi:hypothetical protein